MSPTKKRGGFQVLVPMDTVFNRNNKVKFSWCIEF